MQIEILRFAILDAAGSSGGVSRSQLHTATTAKLQDAAGPAGGVSRFVLEVERYQSNEPNNPPGEPAGFQDIALRLCSGKRNDPPGEPAAFVKRQSLHHAQGIPFGPGTSNRSGS